MLNVDRAEIDLGCQMIGIHIERRDPQGAREALKRLIENLGCKSEHVSKDSHIAEVEQFGVEPRELNMLERAGVCTVGEFVKLEYEQFIEVYQFAKKTTNNLQQAQELARKSIASRAQQVRRAKLKVGPRAG